MGNPKSPTRPEKAPTTTGAQPTVRGTVAGAQSGDKQVFAGTFYAGPVPPPEDLERYNAISPGLSDRLVAMAEREQEHRHVQENLDGAAARDMARTGQYISAALVALMLGGGLYLAYAGRETPATTAIIGSLVTLLVNYIKHLPQRPPKQEPSARD